MLCLLMLTIPILCLQMLTIPIPCLIMLNNTYAMFNNVKQYLDYVYKC